MLLHKISERRTPNIAEYLEQKRIAFVINIPQSLGSAEQTDGYHIRRIATDRGIPLITNVQLTKRIVEALSQESLVATSQDALRSLVARTGESFDVDGQAGDGHTVGGQGLDDGQTELAESMFGVETLPLGTAVGAGGPLTWRDVAERVMTFLADVTRSLVPAKRRPDEETLSAVLGARAHSHFNGPPAYYGSWAYAGTADDALDQLGKFSALVADSAHRTEESLLAELRDIGPVLESLANSGPALKRALGQFATYPFPTDNVGKWARGD